jgi:hypothetical protein
MNKVYSAILAILLLPLLMGCLQVPTKKEKNTSYRWDTPLFRKYSQFIYENPKEEIPWQARVIEGTDIARGLFLQNAFYEANKVATKTLEIKEMTKEQRLYLLKLSADSLCFQIHYGHPESIVPSFILTRINEVKGPSYEGYYPQSKERLQEIIATLEKENIYCDRFRMYAQMASLCCYASDKKESTLWKDKAIAEYQRYSTDKNQKENCGPTAAVSGIPIYCLDRVKAEKKAYTQPNAVALYLSDLLGTCYALQSSDDIKVISKAWQQAGCYMPISRDALVLLIRYFPEEDRDKFPKHLTVNAGDYNLVHDTLLKREWNEEAQQFERDTLSQSQNSDSFDSMVASSKEIMEGALRRNDYDTADSVLMSLLDKFDQYKFKDAEHKKKVAEAILYFKNDVGKYNKNFYSKSRVRLENLK